MSDYQGQDPGATQVLPQTPPAPPSPPPPTPSPGGQEPPRRGTRWWVILLIAGLVGLLGAGVTWGIMRLTNERPDSTLTALLKENQDLKDQVEDLRSEVDSLSGEMPDNVIPPDVPENENNPPATTGPTTEKQFAYVKNGTWTGATPQLTVDYAQFLTGDQANAAAAAHGDESPPPNDYYIVNDNPKLRTFPVKTGITVKVYNWGTGDSSAATNISFGQWFDVMPGGVNPQDEWVRAPYWITITGGEIVKIEQQYLP